MSKSYKQLVQYCKSNDLIQMRGQVVRRDPLSETKRKIVSFEASQVQENHTHETVYTFKIKDFADMCEIERCGRVYDHVFTEVYELKNKAIAFINERGNISIESYMNTVEINRKAGTVSYTIPKALLPHFKRYGQFTRLELLEYLPMRGQYALLLYELLLSWKGAGMVYYTLEDLRRLLEVPESAYKRPVDVMRHVVEKAVEEIREKTNWKIKFETKHALGRGRKLLGVTFIIPKPSKETNKPKISKEKMDTREQIPLNVITAINEQAATITPDPRPAHSSVLAEIADILKNKEDAATFFKKHGEEECAQRLMYAKKNAKNNLAAYLKKVLNGNPIKSGREEAAKKAAEIEAYYKRKLEEELAKQFGNN